MTFSDLVAAIGIPVAVVAATIPWLLDRSALTRLQRLDSIVAAAPVRGGANSLLREARDKIAVKVGMQILMPRYNFLRTLASVEITLGLYYGAAVVLSGGRPVGHFPEGSAPYIVALSLAVGVGLLVIRFFAKRRSAKEIRDKHAIPAEVRRSVTGIDIP